MRATSTTTQSAGVTVHRQFPKAPPPPVHGPISEAAARAWRFLRDEGGFYTPGELGEALLPGVGRKQAAIRASQWLRALVNRRHVALNPHAIRARSYGVTTVCFAPDGETLEPSNPNQLRLDLEGLSHG